MDQEAFIKNTFIVTKDDWFRDGAFSKDINSEEANNSISFEIGSYEDGYYFIYKKILDTENNVLFHKSCILKVKYFIVNNKISILKLFESLANQQIIVGGNESNSITEYVFNKIINSFPSETEKKHYVNSRVTNVLSQYLEGVKDSGSSFEKYLNRRDQIGNVRTISSVKSSEYKKYQFILETLEDMLSKSESYRELDWQAQILDIILILYPKYIKCFPNVCIKDYYTNPSKSTNRFIDLMLVDAKGSIDVIEIKKPFNNCIVSRGTYRGNYTPMKELSGTIMQLEKYIFHLNKWGIQGEKVLTETFKSQLPPDLKVNITNPKGIVILGRDNNLSKEQIFDLEIIKRKYANLIDIITYDDLINRLKNIIKKYQD